MENKYKLFYLKMLFFHCAIMTEKTKGVVIEETYELINQSISQ